MRFIQKFENKKGMKDYEKDFIDSKIKNIRERKRAFEVTYEGITKSFGFKKYNGEYNAKLKAVEFLYELEYGKSEFCDCGKSYYYGYEKQHIKTYHHKKYIKEKCDRCCRKHDVKFIDGLKLCYFCSGEI